MAPSRAPTHLTPLPVFPLSYSPAHPLCSRGALFRRLCLFFAHYLFSFRFCCFRLKVNINIESDDLTRQAGATSNLSLSDIHTRSHAHAAPSASAHLHGKIIATPCALLSLPDNERGAEREELVRTGWDWKLTFPVSGERLEERRRR